MDNISLPLACAPAQSSFPISIACQAKPSLLLSRLRKSPKTSLFRHRKSSVSHEFVWAPRGMTPIRDNCSVVFLVGSLLGERLAEKMAGLDTVLVYEQEPVD